MTHHEMLIELLTTRPYVKIQDVRMFCDYRKRISELRLKRGMNIRPIVVVENGRKIRAYELVKKNVNGKT